MGGRFAAADDDDDDCQDDDIKAAGEELKKRKMTLIERSETAPAARSDLFFVMLEGGEGMSSAYSAVP